MPGLFGMPMAAAMAPAAMPKMQRAGLFGAPAAAAPKGFLDGGKLKGKDALAIALGALGSGFAGNGNFGQFLVGNMMQNRKAEQDAKMAEQQRMANLQDYRTKKEIDLEYPGAPKNPHYWETNDGSLGMVDPLTGKPSILYKDPTPKINWMTIDNGDGTKQVVPVGPNGPMLGGGMAQPQPYNPDDWEVVEGGPSQPAAGGFRR